VARKEQQGQEGPWACLRLWRAAAGASSAFRDTHHAGWHASQRGARLDRTWVCGHILSDLTAVRLAACRMGRGRATAWSCVLFLALICAVRPSRGEKACRACTPQPAGSQHVALHSLVRAVLALQVPRCVSVRSTRLKDEDSWGGWAAMWRPVDFACRLLPCRPPTTR